MVAIRSVEERELDDFRRLHNRLTASDESVETVREWYDERPDLLLAASEDGDLIGFALGVSGENGVQLEGIGARESHRREGIGSALLDRSEAAARERDADRISLGSAGGYVDEFYVANGYQPESVLLRFESGSMPSRYRSLDYDIARERVEDGLKKCYLGVDSYDPAFLSEVREAFDDPEAIYIMEKPLD
jgi:GNAT superfamily N-acetyltransferase